jgi:hypothetical protein
METQGQPAQGHENHRTAPPGARQWTQDEVEFVHNAVRQAETRIEDKLALLGRQLRRTGTIEETTGQKALRYALTGTGIAVISIVANKLWDWATASASDDGITEMKPRATARS